MLSNILLSSKMLFPLPHSGWRCLLPQFLGRKKHPSHFFLVFFVKCLTPKDLRWNWWLSFSEFLASVGRDFLRGGQVRRTWVPHLLFPTTTPCGCESKAPFPSGSSFSPLDSSLPEDVPVFTASAAATPVPSAVPTRYLVSPDCLRRVERGPGSRPPSP